MAKRKSKVAESAETQTHPLICPFSGKPMEIRMVGSTSIYFMVASPHGFTSKLMKTRDECLEWASHRLGVRGYTKPVIEVRHLEAPDNSAESGISEIAPDPGSIDDCDLPPSLR